MIDKYAVIKAQEAMRLSKHCRQSKGLEKKSFYKKNKKFIKKEDCLHYVKGNN